MNRIAERLKHRAPEIAVIAGIGGAIYMAIGGQGAPRHAIAVTPEPLYSSDGRRIFIGPEAPPRRWPWDEVTGDESHPTNARCIHCKYPMQLRSAMGRIICRGCGKGMPAQAALDAIN